MAEATVGDEMSGDVLTIEPERTLADAAREMAQRNVGAIVVVDPEQPGPGIVTERDVSQAVGRGSDPGSERVVDHVSNNAASASPDWPLAKAADAMVSAGYRHLAVIEGTEIVGVLSMRDVVRRWAADAGG